MTDWNLHEEAWQDIRREKVDTYVAAQRKSFLEGFEAAVEEAESFAQIREWAENQRDNARQEYEETDDEGRLGAYHAYLKILIKLSEIGCEPDND